MVSFLYFSFCSHTFIFFSHFHTCVDFVFMFLWILIQMSSADLSCGYSPVSRLLRLYLEHGECKRGFKSHTFLPCLCFLFLSVSSRTADLTLVLLITFKWASDLESFQRSPSRCALSTVSVWSWLQCRPGVRQHKQLALFQWNLPKDTIVGRLLLRQLTEVIQSSVMVSSLAAYPRWY